jgi:hypothetical protein
MIAVVIWIVLSFFVAHLANQKGESPPSYLLLSILLSPIIGLLVLLIKSSPSSDKAKLSSPSAFEKDDPRKSGW